MGVPNVADAVTGILWTSNMTSNCLDYILTGRRNYLHGLNPVLMGQRGRGAAQRYKGRKVN